MARGKGAIPYSFSMNLISFSGPRIICCRSYSFLKSVDEQLWVLLGILSSITKGYPFVQHRVAVSIMFLLRKHFIANFRATNVCFQMGFLFFKIVLLKVLVCNSGRPCTHLVVPVGFKLAAILLPQLSV